MFWKSDKASCREIYIVSLLFFNLVLAIRKVTLVDNKLQVCKMGSALYNCTLPGENLGLIIQLSQRIGIVKKLKKLLCFPVPFFFIINHKS